MLFKSESTATIPLTAISKAVLNRRYLRRGADGMPIETIEEMFHRVSGHIASVEAEYGGDVVATEEKFYNLLTELRFLPNSPTFTGAGTPLGQLAACFVLPISDDMGRDEAGIFQTLRNAALIQQTGGGNGFAFSRLRPKGDLVKTSAGYATGPVGFLRVYDQAFGEVAQGGSRRGANMAVLSVNHPDIYEFISCKASEYAITNFNISVGITDDFMQAVQNDTDFDLVNPRDGKVWQTVRARDLFDEIVKYAHANGEPGILFLDVANRTNPVPHLYSLESTNPCGEQWLGPYENCCLGSINLAHHVTDDGQVDWENLQQTIVEATHFLDNVVTINAYVPAVPQLKEAAYNARRIGLGIMGLADLMYQLRVRYGSYEGQLLASKVMEFVRYHCMRTSIKLARERGAFTAIKGSIYDPQDLKWQVPTALVDGDQDWARPQLDWDHIVADLKAYGIRNAAQTTVAPTGTIASVAGCEGYGCEPTFALAYIRHFNDQGKDVELQYTSPLFEQALIRAAVDSITHDQIVAEVSQVGTCQQIEEVPARIRNTFVVASDITPEEHVRMQAAIQAFVDNSISKTVNFPSHATQEDVTTAYKLAWELGCKGITVYVTGSREKVVLETHATKAAKEKAEVVEEKEKEKDPSTTPNYTNRGEHKRTRKRRLTGATYCTESPLGKAYVTVNRNGNEQPFEVFANVGKVGSEGAAMSEAIGRLISLVLRLPSHISPNERLEMVVEQLEGIGGSRSIGFGANRITSLPDALAQVLREDLDIHHDAEAAYLLNEVINHEPELKAQPMQLFNATFDADLCPECGHASFVRTEGCRKCYSCSYSEC